MKKFLIVLLIIVLVVILVVGGYFAYLYFSYDRVPDNQALDVVQNSETTVAAKDKYSLMSYNIGFGAYDPAFSFFMDGGEHARALSAENCRVNVQGALDFVKEYDPDFIALQEVDVGSDKSYFINQAAMAETTFPEYDAVFAINHDSEFLFYPVTEPIGRCKSGLLTLSKRKIDSSLRRSLPIDESLMKIVDLDRCYTVSRLPMDNGKEFILINMHLTAYTSDKTIVEKQLAMLFEDMQKEYDAGNYVIAVGDMNRVLVSNGTENSESWAQDFDTSIIPEHFALVPPCSSENYVPTCRTAEVTYVEGETTVYVLDGFIVSDNISVDKTEVCENGFLYSDHQPVRMEFSFK